MFYGSDLFDDQEEWFVETVRAACENDRVNWIIKLHPANVWKLQARPLRRTSSTSSSAIREHVGSAPGARPRASPRHGHQHVVAVRHHRLGRDDPRLGRLRAAVLRHACADRRNRLLLGSRLHGRLRLRRRVPRAASRGSRRSRRRTTSEVELARKHAHALFRLRQTRFTSFRTVFQPLERIDRPSRPRSRRQRGTPDELAASLRPASASGPCAHASSTTSSCRSFVSMRGSSSSGSSFVARRGSVVSPAAQPELARAVAAWSRCGCRTGSRAPTFRRRPRRSRACARARRAAPARRAGRGGGAPSRGRSPRARGCTSSRQPSSVR